MSELATKLPNNILHQIFVDVVGKKSPFSYETRAYGFPGDVNWVPSQVCSRWRQIALGHIYRECHASIKEGGQNIVVGPLKNIGEIEYIGHKILEHTSEVNVYVDCQDIFNGKAQHMLMSPRLNSVKFVNATKLNLHIHNYYQLKLDCPKEAFVHAIGLCRRFKIIAPKAKKLEIVYASNYIITDTQFGALFQKFIKEAGSLMSDMSLVSKSIPIPYVRPVDVAGRLTSLVYKWDAMHENTISLVHMNAGTLQSLKIIHACESGMERLLVMHTNEPAIYPILSKLVIEPAPGVSQIRTKQMFPDFAPFPKLRHLDIQTAYPFADDVMFRKNMHTLEYLGLRYDKQLALIFCGAETFSGKKFSALRQVHVRGATKFPTPQKQEPNSMPTNSILAQFFLDVLPSLRLLKIDATDIAAALVASISKEHVYTNIDLLDINYRISAGEVVRLLKSMPNLSHLVSRFSGVGKKFRGLTPDQLVKNMLSRQERLGMSRFRKWSIRGIGAGSDFEAIATSMFLLAAGCTRFSIIPLEKGRVVAYNNAINCVVGKTSEQPEVAKEIVQRLLIPANI
ncbi:hypothetical protein GGI11_000636 [Coemansia sp. RSA 2049]|nr:hypothetical protein GGI11_000636 [Coemansia sp. RSA 2049]